MEAPWDFARADDGESGGSRFVGVAGRYVLPDVSDGLERNHYCAGGFFWRWWLQVCWYGDGRGVDEMRRRGRFLLKSGV